MTSSDPTNRRAYLMACMRISLLKRWFWLALSAISTAVLALALNLGTAMTVAATLAVPLLVGLFIALDSWRRHQSD